MRKNLKKLMCGVAIGVSLLTPFGAFTVNATETTIEESSGGITDEEMKSAFSLDDDALKRGKAYVAIMKADGFSDAAIAGVLGNSVGESHWNPLADEAGKNGGLFGFTPMTKFSNSDYNKNCTHTKGTAGGQSVCADGSCQIAYMMSCLEADMKTYSSRIVSYNKYVSENDTTKMEYSSKATSVGWKGTKVLANVPEGDSLDDFKKATDPAGAMGVFLLCYERAAGTYLPCGISPADTSPDSVVSGYSYTWRDFFLHEFTTEGTRVNASIKVYEWITGEAYDDSDATAEMKETAETLYQMGVWDESKLHTFCTLNEIDLTELLEGANRDNLTNDELTSLQNWEDNTKDEAWYITMGRRITLLIGILIILWGVLFYLGYWFDKINVYFDLDMVGILSMKRLAVSDNEEECTFTLSDLQKTEKRTINHKYALFISLCSVVFGVLIISGFIFTMIRAVVNYFKGLLF